MCPAGEYQPVRGHPSCTLCPTGKFIPYAGSACCYAYGQPLTRPCWRPPTRYPTLAPRPTGANRMRLPSRANVAACRSCALSRPIVGSKEKTLQPAASAAQQQPGADCGQQQPGAAPQHAAAADD